MDEKIKEIEGLELEKPAIPLVYCKVHKIICMPFGGKLACCLDARVKELEEGIEEIYSTMNQYLIATYSLRITIQKVFKLVEKKKDEP